MSASPIKPVAVLGVGAAAPSLRLAAKDVGAAWGSGGGRGTVAVCDSDEDTLTLAWQAANAALEAAGITAEQVSGLWWGTARPPFAEGPSDRWNRSLVPESAVRPNTLAPRSAGTESRELVRA